MTETEKPQSPLMTAAALAVTERLGSTMQKSRLFPGLNEQGATAIIMAGAEMGFGPVASLTGIYLINGKVAPSATLMAAAVKRSGRYDYRVREITNTTCQIEFFERGESVGLSVFTWQDAKAAGLADKATWKQFPRNLLFSRALTNGARWYCPDIFGAPLYTPDELGAEVDATGAVTAVPPAATDAAFTPTVEMDAAVPVPDVTLDALIDKYGAAAFDAAGGLAAKTTADLVDVARRLEAIRETPHETG